jgi:hypothetical protein
MVEIIRIEPGSIDIPENVITARLGFVGERTIPNDFRVHYDTAINKIRSASSPIALLEDMKVIHEKGSIYIENIVIKGDLANKHLSGIKEVTVLLATLGEGVDELIEQEEAQGDTLSSFFMDGIASEMVEFFVRKVDSILRNRSEDRTGRTRISPGYGDLSLDLNHWIVERLDGGAYGVSVVEGSGQLLPRKTVSALIGWRDLNKEQK